MIKSVHITFVDFCDKYELPSGDFYEILRLIKSILNFQTKRNVVIIIDEFLLCSKTSETDQEFLLKNIIHFLDKQYKFSDEFDSLDLIISTADVSFFKRFETKSGRSFDMISLPILKEPMV